MDFGLEILILCIFTYKLLANDAENKIFREKLHKNKNVSENIRLSAHIFDRFRYLKKIQLRFSFQPLV
jgi:hypothetical protein